MTNYSISKIYTIWKIIFLIEKHNLHEFASIRNSVLNSGDFGGTAPFDEAIKIGLKNNLIIISNGEIILTDYSSNELLTLDYDENLNVTIFRKMVFNFIYTNKFHWIGFFDEDIDIFKTAIPYEWIDILESSNLFDFSDELVISWWEELMYGISQKDDERNKQIGDIAEFLTYEFERERLSKDKVQNPGLIVRWVSRISDIYGYDIKSIRGKLLLSEFELSSPICIEVKGSEKKEIEYFSFYITRNEWEQAERNSDSYFFYFWSGINTNYETACTGPYIISAQLIKDFIPVDSHECCKWQKCRLSINLHLLNKINI